MLRTVMRLLFRLLWLASFEHAQLFNSHFTTVELKCWRRSLVWTVDSQSIVVFCYVIYQLHLVLNFQILNNHQPELYGWKLDISRSLLGKTISWCHHSASGNKLTVAIQKLLCVAEWERYVREGCSRTTRMQRVAAGLHVYKVEIGGYTSSIVL